MTSEAHPGADQGKESRKVGVGKKEPNGERGWKENRVLQRPLEGCGATAARREPVTRNRTGCGRDNCTVVVGCGL